MKTPEEIALIGGGILLSSGLVFGLKSGAASELPNVSCSVDTVLQGKKNADSGSSSSSDSANAASQAAAQQKQQQAQQQADNAKKQQEEQAQQAAQKQQAFENLFDGKYQKAQQNHWQTGQWGSAKFYVDDQANLHVGSGQLSGSYSNVVNDQQIKAISLDENVQAPQDSTILFADANANPTPLTQINGLSNLDTSNVTNMNEMFSCDKFLSNLDLSHFDTSNVTNMEEMFSYDNKLSNLDLSHFDTSNVTNMGYMFEEDSSLNSLDISHFDTSSVANMKGMFVAANAHQLTLGSNTKLQNNSINYNYNTFLTGTYQSNGQTLNLDGNAHPGTWYQQ